MSAFFDAPSAFSMYATTASLAEKLDDAVKQLLVCTHPFSPDRVAESKAREEIVCSS
jgi:hypothetical protein